MKISNILKSIKMAKKMYVWLDINTGEFSSSWDEAIQNIADPLNHTIISEHAKENGFKLIEYSCLNDDKFEFIKQMKLR